MAFQMTAEITEIFDLAIVLLALLCGWYVFRLILHLFSSVGRHR